MKLKNSIKVKCVEGFTLHKNNKRKTIVAVVEEGKEYKAILFKPTEEYFAKDLEGRGFFVGEIDNNDKLILMDGLALVEDEGRDNYGQSTT
ncbi:hypothetical protein [Clostridium tyrobutyricum]|uniref:hypothetical protein n=1 Tax=Clostridium tyrobutyricum TaxID=1519 RepID=UPI001C38DFD5|nr:hypothetical protein [Clostridium tyrobutyricum]MBV4417163.1 hypothetical protein [Clostridium tyrobutyricum]